MDIYLISIITPVYNAERYLLQTLETVLAQTYLNWEWIVVDDCSTDNSYNILKEIAAKDKRIKVHKNKINSKAFQTRNNALGVAKGDFIAFLDVDDLWEPEKLGLQLEFMKQNNSYFSYTDFDRFVKDSKKPLRREKLPQTATYKRILTNNYIATSTVMIWRSKTGNFYMKDVYYDDFMLWLDLLKRIGIGYKVPYNLMHYRLTSGSLSINKFKSAKEVYGMFTRKMGFSYIRGIVYFITWIINTTLRYMR
ncbi:glycosyltransferase family 2 protein [Pedobacter sp.]|uniref:glycosyltransferase family 2 protein n=1 Tax=Pedobacter sp. TaxID=1411316 RepID=UPI00396CAFA4